MNDDHILMYDGDLAWLAANAGCSQPRGPSCVANLGKRSNGAVALGSVVQAQFMRERITPHPRFLKDLAFRSGDAGS